MSTFIAGLQTASAVLGISWTGASQQFVGNANPVSIDSGNLLGLSKNFSLGTSAGQIDTIVSQVRAVAASGADTLTLSALAGTASPTTINDVLNQASVVFARVRAIYIGLLTTGDSVGPLDPTPTLASGIVIGDAASNPWVALLGITTANSTMPLLNGESMMKISRQSNGMVVTSGSSDQLKILNSDAGLVAVYRIVLFGCSE